MVKKLKEIFDILKGEEKLILSVAAAEEKEVCPDAKDFDCCSPLSDTRRISAGNAGFCKKTILSELGTLPLRWKWGRFTDYRNSERVYKEG